MNQFNKLLTLKPLAVSVVFATHLIPSWLDWLSIDGLRAPPVLSGRRKCANMRTIFSFLQRDAPLVDLVNMALMTRARRFLFARENSPSVAQAFDRSRLDESLTASVWSDASSTGVDSLLL